jgi:pyruvate formate lyase activating enzyme
MGETTIRTVVRGALQEKLQDGSVRCLICERRCIIAPGKCGFCGTRRNDKGTVKTVVNGAVSSIAVAPAEAKPIFHFLPGSRWLSLGTLGCNFKCPGCQNSGIAWADPCRDGLGRARYKEPGEVVEEALAKGCKGISWTYNEPTMWLEYTVETSELARKNHLYTSYITNGYMTHDALDLIGPHLDVYRFDLKGFSRESYARIAGVNDYEVVLENALRIKSRYKTHVEVVTNVIPGINDADIELGRLATWIATRLGKRTPWHVTRFIPHGELAGVPETPVETLERARKIGMDVGLLYVYTGNVPGYPGENTYCPKCGRVVIGRSHQAIFANYIREREVDDSYGAHRPAGRKPLDGVCAHCGQRIVGHWFEPPRPKERRGE